MTAGKGISHSEESPEERSDTVQLAQFWIALPEKKRFIEPAFEHHAELPRFERQGADITLLVGELLNHTSPVKVYSPLLGVDISTQGKAQVTLPLNPQFEYGVAVLTGAATVAEHDLTQGFLLYLGTNRTEITLDIPEASQIILIGGEPFAEKIMLYCNFVARTTEEVREYIKLWHETDHFGNVEGYDGEPLRSPEL